MDRDTDREGLRFPLRYNLIGIDCNSWGLADIHSLAVPHAQFYRGTYVVGSQQQIQSNRFK